MNTNKTFLFFCRDTYEVVVKKSSVGYGLWVGDGVDVVVATSVKDGLNVIKRTDKMFEIDDGSKYRHVGSVTQEEFDNFLLMRQAGELDHYR